MKVELAVAAAMKTKLLNHPTTVNLIITRHLSKYIGKNNLKKSTLLLMAAINFSFALCSVDCNKSVSCQHQGTGDAKSYCFFLLLQRLSNFWLISASIFLQI